MLVESIEVKISKKDAMKYILRKMPLMSKVEQFNRRVKDINLEYVEFKILSYEIISKGKNNKLFRHEIKKDNITMLVNTYNGYSESIDNIPVTVKRYVAKGCIKKSRIEESHIIDEVKIQIIHFLGEKSKAEKIDKLSIQDINILEIKSIYKPYWIGNFNGRQILIDA